LDGEYSIQGYEEITNEEYDSLLSSYINSLSKQYETAAYDCGSLSVGNYPTGEMMSSPDFDYQYYIEHKDEPQSIDNANREIADSIKQNILIWENTAISSDIFIDNVKYLNDYNENEFNINSKKAMSDIIDLLVEYEKWQEDFKLICSGMAELDGEAFYQITLSTENDFSYSDVGTFWVNADNGTVYLKFDPTLDAQGYFSEFAVNIPEDDYRTRLVRFSPCKEYNVGDEYIIDFSDGNDNSQDLTTEKYTDVKDFFLKKSFRMECIG
jgi:hypothetical protein